MKAGYGSLPVLHGVTMRVCTGELVAIFGPNGAGKSTLAKTVIGFLPLSGGEILYADRDLGGMPPERRLALGIAYVPQEANTFPALSVEDNIRVGLIGRRKANGARALQRVFDMFPVLAARRSQTAGTLSGGERQMLALASAIVLEPDFLIVDEPTSGLGPIIVNAQIEHMLRIVAAGTAVVWIVGDDADKILPEADRRYLLQSGTMAGEWPRSAPLRSDRVAELYFSAARVAETDGPSSEVRTFPPIRMDEQVLK